MCVCVCRTLLRMSLAMDVRLVLYSVRLRVLNCNFSKEQCVIPEDELMIETCRSVLSVNVKVF